MRRMTVAAMAAMLGFSAPAMAEECPSASICAAQPEGVVASLQTQGYKATLGKTDDGKPKISSVASGYNYDIFFYDCVENADCKSIQFRAWFSKSEGYSPQLANKWNLEKRFATMSFDPKDGMIGLSYDISTIGGLSQVHFADTVEWWDTMLGQVGAFMEENGGKKKKK